MQAETFRLFWLKSPQYWFNELKSNPKGLTEEEAASRIATSSNKKTSKSSFEKDVTLFLSQFKNPLMLLLIGATVISYFLGDTSDVIIILFIVISGSLLSFFQERNAGKVVEKLKHLIEIKSTVIRNGILTEVNANNIVPGDIIQLIAGDIIPADCLLFEINELHVNESSLTGESFPCLKQLGNITNEA
ncbi:MAG: HAD-IC family P-type ATPase, partial [Bacteroidia bacterium]|nr:HAD-IC family P-type ATPase [Bacteroidia bacterium]